MLEKLKEQEPDAWRTFDGEGGYDYRSYVDNEKYQAEFLARNPSPTYKNWVEALYLHPLPTDDVVRDAERYRWLRDSGKGDNLIRGDCRGIYLPESVALDQAIDSAMEKA